MKTSHFLSKLLVSQLMKSFLTLKAKILFTVNTTWSSKQILLLNIFLVWVKELTILNFVKDFSQFIQKIKKE